MSFLDGLSQASDVDLWLVTISLNADLAAKLSTAVERNGRDPFDIALRCLLGHLDGVAA